MEDVGDAYRALLGRDPDEGGLIAYAYALVMGELSLEQVWEVHVAPYRLCSDLPSNVLCLASTLLRL